MAELALLLMSLGVKSMHEIQTETLLRTYFVAGIYLRLIILLFLCNIIMAYGRLVLPMAKQALQHQVAWQVYDDWQQGHSQ